MKHLIAANSQHAGAMGNGSRGYAEPFTSEQVDSLLSEDWLKQLVTEIRGGNWALKDSLPFICPHYSRFNKNHRSQANIIPEAFTFMTCVDVDDLELVDQAIRNTMAVVEDDYNDWQDKVLRIEYSARKKVHIWLRLPIGLTIAETQEAFCEEIGLSKVNDTSCISPERFIYQTTLEDEIYRSPGWLEKLSDDELEERREAYLKRGLDVDGRLLQVTSDKLQVTSDHEPLTINQTYHGVPYSKIVDAWLNGKPVKPGDRHHTSLYLAKHLRYITENDAALIEQILRETPFVQEIIRERNEDVARTVADAQKYEYKEFIPRKMKNALKRVGIEDSYTENQNNEDDEVLDYEPQSDLSKLFASSLPPELPNTLPRLVKAVTSSTPQCFKATVAQGMFPPLGAYPKKLSFVYIDNQERELRMNCLVVAGSGTGKDTCMTKPLMHILADMAERDEFNRKRLEKFNEEYNSKENNKKKPQRPDDLIIQYILSNVTDAALVQRMKEANGAPLYVRLNELEQWDQIESSSGRKNQFTTMKLCDDEGNRFGSDRAGTQSVVATGCLHLNWNANTTVGKVMRYFRYVMTDGPISRLCLATIPEEEIGADIAVFGDYDSEYDAELKPFIDNLKVATGVIDCPQAKRLAKKLKAECAEFARLSQDRVFDNLTHRALVAAFRKACLLYAANGMKWERAIESFCRWSLFYDLYLKMHFFGDLIRRAEGEVQTSKCGPRSLLDLLPEVFTLTDAMQVRMKMGMSNEGNKCNNMINQWVHRNHVLQMTNDNYKKVSR